MNRRKFLTTNACGAGLAHTLRSEQGAKTAPDVPGEDSLPLVTPPFSPLRIGTASQLFVERSIVRNTERVWFTLHPGEKHPRNPMLKADREWESWRVKTYGNVIFDEDEKVFKMWYDSPPPSSYFDRKSRYSLYAFSRDGVEWEKPLVGTIESPKLGFRHNVVLPAQFANVIKDYREPDPARRYKAFCLNRWDETEGFPYYRFASPDGLHWTRLDQKPVRDDGDVMTSYYDDFRSLWVSFFKRKLTIRGQMRRCFYLMHSKDSVNWSEPRLVFAPDDQDDAGSWARLERVAAIREAPPDPILIRTEFYGVGAYVAESCTVAFPWIFTVNAEGKYGNQDGPIEIQLAGSRDLVNWQRHFRTPCIVPGSIGEWDSGLFYTQSRAIRRGDEIWLYFAAANFTHAYPGRHSKEHADARTQNTTSIGLVKWKVDRFVSADAGAEGGVLTTVPFVHEGDRLEINARVRQGGSIRAEFLDAGGKPVSEAGVSAAFTGDSLGAAVSWRDQGMGARFKSKPVSLRFHLQNAELYSFAFRTGERT